MVRVTYAENIAQLAETALRFLMYFSHISSILSFSWPSLVFSVFSASMILLLFYTWLHTASSSLICLSNFSELPSLAVELTPLLLIVLLWVIGIEYSKLLCRNNDEVSAVNHGVFDMSLSGSWTWCRWAIRNWRRSPHQRRTSANSRSQLWCLMIEMERWELSCVVLRATVVNRVKHPDMNCFFLVIWGFFCCKYLCILVFPCVSSVWLTVGNLCLYNCKDSCMSSSYKWT